MKTLFIALSLSALLSAPMAQAGAIKEFALTDAGGKKHTRAEWKGKKAIVLIFLGTDCPVSNFYAPEYSRLTKVFTDRGVLFYGIHPDPEVSAADAAKHAREYRLSFPVLLDPTHLVSRPAGVEVVPSAVLLDPEGKILYRGRIDDRYTAEGVRREAPTKRDLEEALKAVLDGKAPPSAGSKGYGCPLPEPAKPK